MIEDFNFEKNTLAVHKEYNYIITLLLHIHCPRFVFL